MDAALSLSRSLSGTEATAVVGGFLGDDVESVCGANSEDIKTSHIVAQNNFERRIDHVVLCKLVRYTRVPLVALRVQYFPPIPLKVLLMVRRER